jgi:hypothetical protein
MCQGHEDRLGDILGQMRIPHAALDRRVDPIHMPGD